MRFKLTVFVCVTSPVETNEDLFLAAMATGVQALRLFSRNLGCSISIADSLCTLRYL